MSIIESHLFIVASWLALIMLLTYGMFSILASTQDWNDKYKTFETICHAQNGGLFSQLRGLTLFAFQNKQLSPPLTTLNRVYILLPIVYYS